MRSPVKRARPDPHRDRARARRSSTPAALHHLRDRRHQLARVRGRLEQPLGRGRDLEALAVRRAARRRRWPPSRCRSRGAFTRSSIRRRSPPRCSSRTRAATRSRAGSATRRPLDERDPLRGQVVVQQRRVLARERAEPVEVEVRHLDARPRSTCPIVKVGLVTGPSRPSARQAPRTNVVLPLPSSPLTSTTSPGRSRRASSAPAASVSLRRCGLDERQSNRSICGGSGAGSGASAATGATAPIGTGGGSASSSGRRREVLAQLLERLGAAQRRGRVEERVDAHRPPAELVHLGPPVHAGDPALGAGQQLGGEVAERADHPRLDQLDLLVQVGLAGLDLLGLRVAVARRPALEDVRDEHVGARPARPRRAAGRAACPARPTNGSPCRSSCWPGRLADEHQVGVGVAGAEDHLGAALVQRAACAAASLPVEVDQGLAALLGAACLHEFKPRGRGRRYP